MHVVARSRAARVSAVTPLSKGWRGQMNRLPLPVIDSVACTGCGTCIELCATDALALRHGKAMLAAVHETSPGEYLIDTDPSPANIATLTGWLAERDLPLADIRAGRQRLEDVFLRMTAITGELPSVAIDEGRRRGRSAGRARRS